MERNIRKKHDKLSFKYKNFSIKSSGNFMCIHYLKNQNRCEDVKERKTKVTNQ